MNKKHYVYVTNDDKAVIREVEIGIRDNSKIEIRKGLTSKDKIIYIVQETEPKDIIYQDKLNKTENPKNWRANAVKRIAHQRNKLLEEVSKHADEEDYILYSDNDEIPKLDSLDLSNLKNNFFVFEQLFFYYKFRRP